ncbi:MAG: phenylacetate--CoA ligase family protein [Candidatus Eiseniibacteriota bacterium]
MTATETAIFDREVETRDSAEQRTRDAARYPTQIAYLFERSPFYRRKLEAAGFKSAEAAGGLDAIAHLPFTEKDELRQSQAEHPPFGDHLAAAPERIMRIYSTSGTTGVPCYIAVTPRDLHIWTEISARSYVATGVRRGRRVVSTYSLGPFVAGAAGDSMTKIGVTHIPVGTGNTERLIGAIRRLGADVIMGTPSYAVHVIDWCRARGIATETLGVKQIAVAGEPGGGDPVIRRRIEEAFRCKVNEAMGIGDVSISLWGECEEQGGMHFGGRDFVHVELIDPASGAALPLEDGAEGEAVYTALEREAMPLLRFRSRDHVVVTMKPCACGRTAPRVRCIGRTDDMLIVRGVNVFPSAIREIVNRFQPKVSGYMAVRPSRKGVKQEPPLKVAVELAQGAAPEPALAAAISEAIRSALVVSTEIALLPAGTLPRSEYKSKLLDYSEAKAA